MPAGNNSTVAKPGSRLRELGLVLPKPPSPLGAYVWHPFFDWVASSPRDFTNRSGTYHRERACAELLGPRIPEEESSRPGAYRPPAGRPG